MKLDVVDLFAGPGGLGEGFSSYKDKNNERIFSIVASVEVGEEECRTLRLRSFARKLVDKGYRRNYVAYLKNPTNENFEALTAKHPKIWELAVGEVINAEISSNSHSHILSQINKNRNLENPLILLGGPPCQAYSLVGRARKSKDIKANCQTWKEDAKHTLYKEYLKYIEDLQPDVFVMENVKGMLSATHEGESVFNAVREGLERINPGYSLFSLTAEKDELANKDFLIKSEEYGIPQARHRVIIVGVANHIKATLRPLTKASTQITVQEAIGDLPRLRSSYSLRSRRVAQSWESLVRLSLSKYGARNTAHEENMIPSETGGEWVKRVAMPKYKPDWFNPLKLDGVSNHETRTHMAKDIERYVFSALFAEENSISPKLSDFPKNLLPEHKNIKKSQVDSSIFNDRFKVQVKDRPSSTVTSHISKDGHYFIHYDPEQARSLTVREAARLQTFPDDYRFEGGRTSQYHQVGNAVPPLLAHQIAERVFQLFE